MALVDVLIYYLYGFLKTVRHGYRAYGLGLAAEYVLYKFCVQVLLFWRLMRGSVRPRLRLVT